MATIALGVVGSFFGPVGGLLGSAIGAVIDQAVIYPAIFPKPDVQGPRISDFSLQTASEGSGVNVVFGTARMAGTLMWAGPAVEHKDTVGGGKGGGGGGTSTYTYTRSLTIGVCKGPVQAIRKIWADSRLVYTSTGFHNLLRWSDEFQNAAWVVNPSGTHSVVVQADADTDPDATTKADRITINATGSEVEFAQRHVQVKPDTDYTLSFYVKQGTLTSGNFSIWDRTNRAAIADNEAYSMSGSWTRVTRTFHTANVPLDIHGHPISEHLKIDVILVATPAATGDFYLYGAQLEEGAAATVYDSTNDISSVQAGVVYSNIAIYLGTYDQPIDPTEEAVIGVGLTPANRGRVKVVFTDFQLTPFGNRIPNFTFLVDETVNLTTDVALAKIFDYSGFDSSEYDVGDVFVTDMDGVLFTGPQVPIKLFESVLTAKNIMAVERGTQMVMIQREKSVPLEVPDEVLAAHEQGERNYPHKVQFRDMSTQDVPAEVNVTYQDPALDYQRGDMRERRALAVSDTVKSYDLPLVLSAYDARNVAYHALWAAWSEMRGIELSLPPSYIALEEADLINVHVDDEVHSVRITNLTRGDNFLTQIKGVVESSQTILQVASDQDSQPVQFMASRLEADTGTTTAIHAEILDIPALRDDDATKAGFYYAMAASEGEKWRGGVLYSSSDDANLDFVVRNNTQAVMGRAEWALPAVTSTAVMDTINELDVVLYNGELESVTEDDVLLGKNWFLIGDEIVGVMNCELIGGRAYKLSGFLRGMRNSEDKVDTHAEGERVVLLDSGVQFKPLNIGSVGLGRYYRGVPVGSLPEDFDSFGLVTMTGATLKPFSPVNIEGLHDTPAAGDVTFSWFRQTRMITSPFSFVTTPVLSDETNNYEIDILNSTGDVLRTITVSNDTSAVYTSAQQVTDGLTPGDPVTIAIYQISTLVGRGFAGQETV